MSRTLYLAIMLGTTTLMPAIVWLLQWKMASVKKTNIPNRDYWFDDQNFPATVRFLENHAAWFAVALVFFMCAVHWFVVQANLSSIAGAQLDTKGFLMALASFAVFAGGWVIALYARFRRSGA